jgi:hypothetical protein
MFNAVQRVRDRLRSAVNTLEDAHVPYAVIGDNAVEAWVSRADESAVRTSQDVEILVDQCDYERAKAALTTAGFACQDIDGAEMSLTARITKDVVRYDLSLLGDSQPLTTIGTSRAWPRRMPLEHSELSRWKR